MRRIASDWEQIKKDFTGHKNIIVTPVGEEPPEKYHVTYFVNGIYLLPDGSVQKLGRHEVEITLHAEYPRFKPICKILTPIWHPNFRDGQICIGDIWGAGESLADIIVNIGDMIQYKSWNSYSPLSAEAARWAMENRHLFPVGDVNLNIADDGKEKRDFEIELFDETPESDSPPQPTIETEPQLRPESQPESQPTPEPQPEQPQPFIPVPALVMEKPAGNDFDITAEELAGIEFVPTAQRMQTVAHGGLVKGRRINFKTIFVKGLLWALIGAILGFGGSELMQTAASDAVIAKISGYTELADFYELWDQTDKISDQLNQRFYAYCRDNDLNPKKDSSFDSWADDMTTSDQRLYDQYIVSYENANDAYETAYENFDGTEDEFYAVMDRVNRTSTGVWFSFVALFIGLMLGIGEGVYYGSAKQALRYALISAGISVAAGFISGYIAQWMYAGLLNEDTSDFMSSMIRGFSWAVMGIGVGLAVGLIKPEKKRLLYCTLGGLIGAFLGGFIFNGIYDLIPNDIVSRCVGIIVMGILIGLGVGLLEQFAKQAWLKVIRGEFEGKEYLVFAGTTSIGNNAKNTIVLFKDKLVAPHHCDIVLEGSKYTVVDQGSPLGTVVNGRRIQRQMLKKGDTIAIGNSVLVFNTK